MGVITLEKKDANSKYEEYSKIIDDALNNQEYIQVASFCEAKRIRTYDTAYEKYYPIIRACNSYSNVYDYIFDIKNINEYNNLDNKIQFLVNDLDYFYKALVPEAYDSYEGANSQENIDNLKKIKESVEALIVT